MGEARVGGWRGGFQPRRGERHRGRRRSRRRRGGLRRGRRRLCRWNPGKQHPRRRPRSRRRPVWPGTLQPMPGRRPVAR
ncbi:hypothetical protein E3N94_15590 [Cryobacterium sp. Sr3]|nr:hypothetical protein E3N94_15590 [Cryobacterium sp. Sr3]TFC36353.1 hypothetical protein E3O28_08460 [Cryobacterium sp. TMT2-14]